MYKKSFLNEIDFPLPEYVRKENGICPNWILPLDQLSFGVEIECYDRNGIQEGNVGYPSREVNPDYLPSFGGFQWKVEEDGSLDFHEGCEFISPVLYGSKGISNCVKVIKKLSSLGFEVNRDCGIHIHVGLSSICGSKRVDDVVSFLCRLNKSMFNYQGSLFGSCGEVRRDRNSYCQRLRNDEDLISIVRDSESKSKGSKDLNDFNSIWSRSHKYRSLNISKLSNGIKGNSSSLEFRYPSSSMNSDKFLLHIIQIVWLIRQSWVDRHNRKGSDSVCDSWVLDKGFQSDPRNEGVKGFEFMSRKIQNSIRGKWLRWENPDIFHSWSDIWDLWKDQSFKYDSKYFD